MAKSLLELAMLSRMESNGFNPEREFRFCPDRKWRFDFAFPDHKVAVECEGGVWTRGRHTRPIGFINDCEKYNKATVLGWKVFRFTTANVDDLIGILKDVLKQ